MEASWPEGPKGTAVVTGRARDIRTGDANEGPELLCSVSCTVRLSNTREILNVLTEPMDSRAHGLKGLTAGWQSRAALAGLFGVRESKSSALCGLLDDLVGLSIIAPWAWFVSQALTSGGDLSIGPMELERQADEFGLPKHDVCLGHSLVKRKERVVTGEPTYTLGQPARDLTLLGDQWAAHDLASQPGVTMRRVRWFDLHREDDALHVGLGFQDSASAPHFDQRRTVHQYTGNIVIRNGMLTDISVTPEVLPYRACFSASDSLSLLRPIPIEDLNSRVPTILFKTLGCTHLNDMMRTLSVIPSLELMLKT